MDEGANYDPTALSELQAAEIDGNMDTNVAQGRLCSVLHQHTYVQHAFNSL